MPISKGQTKYVIVVVDYFTKSTEAEALAQIIEQKLTGFICKLIICKFGIIYTIVTDSGWQFDNPKFRGLCQQFNIRNSFSAMANPQVNG